MIITDTCYGVIPLRRKNGDQEQQQEWEILVIQHLKGEHWAFPKGHPEPNETALESAKRELHEETGLVIDTLLVEQPLTEHYNFENKRGDTINKSVHYFLAQVSGTLVLQAEEVKDSRWVPINDAHTLLTFDAAKNLLKSAIDALHQHSINDKMLDSFHANKHLIIDSHSHIHEDVDNLEFADIKLPLHCTWLMGTTVDDWTRVNRYGDRLGTRTIRCFGVHPWFVHLVHPPKELLDTNPEQDPTKMVSDTYPTVINTAWPDQLRQQLTQYPNAMVGEIGVDRVTKCRATGKNEQAEQWIVFDQLIKIAVEFNRLVSLHCVQLHGKLLDYFIALPIDQMPRKIALHTFSGKPSTVDSFAKMKTKGNRFYFGISFINLSSSKVYKMIKSIPDDRLLLESDQNTPLEAESSILDVVMAICKAKEWTVEQTITITRQNAIEFQA
ncbi:hypothetical protein SAMD00019534_010930 [Acytostelium subglobosum LB1]|uniref:hypothetical protein n=1 Tax=Acytostelium subglobosum LB1 TaxID=1410327 RepID=UPI000644A2E1|nr:hypothetical protein SAMD00019534_010930 [Acytostelium subglobosum LB1]GAM17918.1 hypothetical protein SAMD00019534_010930 [Acytostelium subglobosum LB1]|eukprot:XP_012758514.1 hypothetical protein SAMD00019534_010930 [Acytostelium subglobosum LB1]